MGQIQKGLEDFLDRELQLYTLEEEKKREKELNVIGSATSQKSVTGQKSTASRQNANARQRADRGQSAGNRSDRSGRQTVQDFQFYEEDWDQKSDRSVRSSGDRRNKSTQSTRYETSVRGRNARTDDRSDRKNRRDSRSKEKKPAKKKSRLKRFLLTAALVIFLAGAGLYWLVGVVYNKLNYTEIASVSNQPMQENGVVNILLIGNDSRQNGDDGRSDAMILLSISSKTKTIYMTSLLRDMYVDIPGRDGNRLNAAYSYGGAELLMETVEKNLDISVNRCVQVNFEAFANLVDAVGGVDLELSTAEIEYVNGYLVEYNMLTNRPQGTDNMDPAAEGMVHLNGPQALAYCRNRYIGTDFGRTERQRKVLTEVIKKLPLSGVTNGKELVDGLMPNLTTNLTRGECFRLSLMAGRFLTYDIVTDSIPQPNTYKDATIRGMSVLEVDFEANRKYLREKLYGEGEQ